MFQKIIRMQVFNEATCLEHDGFLADYKTGVQLAVYFKISPVGS
jgi:hypothetical protein